MRFRSLVCTFTGLLAIAGVASADTIVRKNGTVLVGVVRQVDEGYEITSSQGRSTFVPYDDVKSLKLSNDGKVTEQNAKERLASLRRSIDAESQIDRIIERYKQFIEMNKDTDASDGAVADLKEWETRKQQGAVKVGSKWMTPAERDQYLVETAKLANEIADLIAAGNVGEASNRVARGLDADPNNLSLAYLDGVLKIRRERYNEAKQSFDIVADQIPDHPPTLFNQAAIATNFKRWPNALSILERVMISAPNRREILDGVSEFLRLLPETQKRSSAFDRFVAIYDAQEQALEATMAKQGLYRFGSGWADQARIDEMKTKIKAYEDQKREVQSQFDASQEKMKQLAREIETIDQRLSVIERDRIYVDPITGRTAYMPRPQYYYDLQADRDRYVRDLQEEQTKSDDLRQQAKKMEANAPQPPFQGRLTPIGEAGVPIVLPAGFELVSESSSTQPSSTSTDASTRPANTRSPFPLLPEETPPGPNAP